MNLDQLIFTSKGRHLVLALFASISISYKTPPVTASGLTFRVSTV